MNPIQPVGVNESDSSGVDDTSIEESPLVSLMLLPFLAASMRAGSWARTPNIRSSPTAVRTLPSMMPMGGSKKPPMMSRRLIAKVK